MKILTVKYWGKFRKTIINKDGTTKQIKDGSKFESLIKKLLDLEYGLNRWKSTGMTYDGSRDFEYRTKNSFKWAECKNYNSSISLNVISNTLIMALLDFADEILIFSYSKIKKPVLKKLIQYADVSQKILRIYADDSLEPLILKHINSLRDEFFPLFNSTTVPQEFLPLYLSCNIIADPVTAYTMNSNIGNIAKAPDEINFNSILCLFISIYNPRISEIQVEIKLDWKKCDFSFEVLNKENKDMYKVKIDNNRTCTEKIFFYPIRYKEKLIMPQVTICYEKNEKIFSFPKVKCSWIGECILQGSSYRSIRDTFSPKVLNGSYFSAIHIHGTSGSGKSRMLAEFQNISLGYGYRVVRLSIEKLELTDSFTTEIMTEFICAVYDIPDMNDFLQADSYDETKEVCIMLTHLVKKEALKADEYEFILSNLLRKLQSTKCYISLDNIQYYPEQFVSFLLDLLKRLLLSNNACNSRIGIVMNTDYLYYQPKHEEIYSLLISSKDRIVNYKLDGFSSDGEAKVYLNQLLSSTKIKDEYIDKMLAASANNPYFIHSLLVSLETEGILVRNKEIYILPENMNKEFYQKIEEIKNVNEIIENRWTYYLKNHILEETLYIFSLLHIFQELNNEVIAQFSLSQKNLESLCKYHFLIKNGKLDTIYRFEHDLTESFFSQKYFPLCKYAYMYNLDIQIKHSIFRNLKTVTSDAPISVNEYRRLWKLEFPYKLGYEFYTLFFKKILNNIQTYNDIDQYIEIAFSICESCRERYGTEPALKLYNDIVMKISMDFSDYQKNINWAWAMASFCNVLYEHNEYQKACDYIRKILIYLDDNEPSYIRGFIYNRIHVYERANNEAVLPSIYRWLEKSEKIQEESNIIELKFVNYIDRGYCIYSTKDYREQLQDFWSKACDLYEKENLVTKKMNYYYHKAQVFILKQQFDNALKTIENGFNAIANHEDGVYYITYFSERYLICKIACLLMMHEEDGINKVHSLFLRVEEYNYKLQSRSDYAIQFLKGILSFYQKDFFNAILCLQKAKALLLNNKKLTFQGIYLEQLYQNIQYFTVRWLESEESSINISAITDIDIKKHMRIIMKMSKDVRYAYLDAYNPTGIFQSKDGKINYPVL